MQFQ